MSAPVVAWPPPSRYRIAGITVGQLVCWQIAAVLAVEALRRPAFPALAPAAAAALLVVATGLRFRRGWLHVWLRRWLAFRLRRWLAFRLRRRRLRTGATDRPELALLRAVARVHDIVDVEPGGAVVEHAAGSTAVLELSRDGVVPQMLELPTVLLREHGPDVSIQLVMHIRPAAGRGWESQAWLAIQVFRDGERNGAQLRRALATAVRQAGRELRRLGYAAAPVDADSLYDDVRAVTGLDGTAVEHWRHWRTAGRSQQVLRLRSWRPRGVPGEDLVAAMLTADGLATTVAIAARRLAGPAVTAPGMTAPGMTAPGMTGLDVTGLDVTAPDVTALDVTVRLTERSDRALDTAIGGLTRKLTEAGASVERLDGRAAHGLASTLPLGGFCDT
jgi:type VII secretion protein EccE